MQQQMPEWRPILFSIRRRHGNLSQLRIQILFEDNPLQGIRFIPSHTQESLRRLNWMPRQLTHGKTTRFSHQTRLAQSTLHKPPRNRNTRPRRIHSNRNPRHGQCRITQLGGIVQIGLQSFSDHFPRIGDSLQDGITSFGSLRFQFFQNEIMIFTFLTDAAFRFGPDFGQFGFGTQCGFVFSRFASHFFLAGDHFFLLFKLFFLHVFLSIQHVDLTLSLEFIHIIGTVSFMLRLGIQSLPSFFGFAFNILCPCLLGIGIHFGALGGMFMLLGSFLRFDQFDR
mmetsp:Transcript_51914/g.78843  ORF Transcript_51914/g.78843 Transcript_51914/m.78843 type:complete len:282 (+) Transcript_51914:718-1563(+)